MKIIYLLSELIPSLLLGYLLGKYNKNFSLLFARMLIKYGIPVSLIGLLLKAGLNIQLVETALIAIIFISLSIIILNYIPRLNKHLDSRTLQLGATFGNTGYFGIPVSLSLLPNDSLIYSIGFDLGATLIIWSLGPLFLTENLFNLLAAKHWRFYFQTLINSPAIKGLIGALMIQATPWNEQITSYLWIPSRIVIMLALVIVGMRLSLLRVSTISIFITQIKSIQNSLILKLIGLPTLMLGICIMIQLPNIIKNALVLQAAAPTAISVLLIAEANSQDEEKATLLVMSSTILALITIPIWALILRL